MVFHFILTVEPEVLWLLKKLLALSAIYMFHSTVGKAWCLTFSMFIWLILHAPLCSHRSSTDMSGIKDMGSNWCRQQRWRSTWIMWVVLLRIWRKIVTRLSWFLRGGGPRQWNKCPTHLLCILNLSPAANTLRQIFWCERCLWFLLDSVFSFSMRGSGRAYSLYWDSRGVVSNMAKLHFHGNPLQRMESALASNFQVPKE